MNQQIENLRQKANDAAAEAARLANESTTLTLAAAALAIRDADATAARIDLLYFDADMSNGVPHEAQIAADSEVYNADGDTLDIDLPQWVIDLPFDPDMVWHDEAADTFYIDLEQAIRAAGV